MSDFAPVPRSALPGGRTSPGSGQLSGLAQTGNPTLEQPLRSPVQGQGHTVPFFFSFKESLSCHFRTKKVKPHNKTLNSKSRDGYSRRGLPVVSSYPTAPVVLGTMKLPVTEELGNLYAQVTQTAVRGERSSAGSPRPLPGAVGHTQLCGHSESQYLPEAGLPFSLHSHSHLSPRPSLPVRPAPLRLLARCCLCPTSPASPPSPPPYSNRHRCSGRDVLISSCWHGAF